MFVLLLMLAAARILYVYGMLCGEQFIEYLKFMPSIWLWSACTYMVVRALPLSTQVSIYQRSSPKRAMSGDAHCGITQLENSTGAHYHVLCALSHASSYTCSHPHSAVKQWVHHQVIGKWGSACILSSAVHRATEFLQERIQISVLHLQHPVSMRRN